MESLSSTIQGWIIHVELKIIFTGSTFKLLLARIKDVSDERVQSPGIW